MITLHNRPPLIRPVHKHNAKVDDTLTASRRFGRSRSSQRQRGISRPGDKKSLYNLEHGWGRWAQIVTVITANPDQRCFIENREVIHSALTGDHFNNLQNAFLALSFILENLPDDTEPDENGFISMSMESAVHLLNDRNFRPGPGVLSEEILDELGSIWVGEDLESRPLLAFYVGEHGRLHLTPFEFERSEMVDTPANLRAAKVLERFETSPGILISVANHDFLIDAQADEWSVGELFLIEGLLDIFGDRLAEAGDATEVYIPKDFLLKTAAERIDDISKQLGLLGDVRDALNSIITNDLSAIIVDDKRFLTFPAGIATVTVQNLPFNFRVMVEGDDTSETNDITGQSFRRFDGGNPRKGRYGDFRTATRISGKLRRARPQG